MSETEETTVLEEGQEKCVGCDEVFESEQEGRWSNVKEAWVCDSCVEGQYHSVAWLVDEEGAHKHFVGDYEVMTEDGDDAEDLLSRRWVSTDGWRGYEETRPTGDWTEAKSGWTTGDWGDGISNSKRSFNEWAEGVIKGEISLPCKVWIVFDVTSNVFSTSVGVFVPSDFEGDLDAPDL